MTKETRNEKPQFILFAGENCNMNAGMNRPSPTFTGLGFWPVSSGQEGLQSGPRCTGETWEIATVRISAIERPKRGLLDTS
jgi:hypothetical protein